MAERTARTPSIGANITRIRATLTAAERQLGFPLTEGHAALDRLEEQVKELRRRGRVSVSGEAGQHG